MGMKGSLGNLVQLQPLVSCSCSALLAIHCCSCAIMTMVLRLFAVSVCPGKRLWLAGIVFGTLMNDMKASMKQPAGHNAELLSVIVLQIHVCTAVHANACSMSGCTAVCQLAPVSVIHVVSCHIVPCCWWLCKPLYHHQCLVLLIRLQSDSHTIT